MINAWFKFYGSEYLSDPKMKSFTACERQCWLILLCHSSVSDCPGVIKHLSEKQLMLDAGVDPFKPEWKETEGVLKKFSSPMNSMVTVDDNGVITINNWNKKQEKSLSGYERIKRYRMRNDNGMITDDNNDNADDNARREKIREEKIRIDKKEVIDLPEWINKDVWKLWVDYRSEIRKKMTPRTANLQLKFLENNKANHIKIIETSIMNGWMGLFPLKKGYGNQSDYARAHEKRIQAESEENDMKENEKTNEALRKIREQIKSITANKTIS